MKYAGVDGCPAGWVVAFLSGPTLVCPTLAEVVAITAQSDLTLIDIPLGLEDQRYMRAPCQAARELLGPRRSSIFAVPVRAAVYAPDYRSACDRNQAATGRRLSVQSWNICRKIAEADLALRADPSLQMRLRESHPELCFAALNGWSPLRTSKKTPEGRAERLAILQRHTPEVALPTSIPRSQAAPDDILDAMVLAVSARIAAQHSIPTLPPAPETDALGIRMEIVTPYLPGK